MNTGPAEPDFEVLVNISKQLYADYADTDVSWEGSPFAWIKHRPSRQKGAIAEKIVASLCTSCGLKVARSPDSDADRLVEGVRVEIKFSTLWKTGIYKFQQLRDQNYRIAILLGVSPFDAHCWVLTKNIILEQWNNPGGIVPQHGGSSGVDTAWLSLDPHNVPPWLRPLGGSLPHAMRVLRSSLSHTATLIPD
jgi:hypothetical protein